MLLAMALTGGSVDAVDDRAAKEPVATQVKVDSFEIEVPASGSRIRFVRVEPAPAKEGEASVPGGVRAFYIATTETPWEAFDVFVYRLDVAEGLREGVDAESRPTKPYVPPDRGFGHDGYAVISVSARTATKYGEWLAGATGKKLRLPTQEEWALAATDAGRPKDAEKLRAWLDERAWHAGNSQGKPQAVAAKLGDTRGVHDLLGNVGEWATNAGGFVLMGGSYRDQAASLTPERGDAPSSDWNRSDPQIPKSVWWLADAPFAGFRLVCESDESGLAPAALDAGEKKVGGPTGGQGNNR